MEMVRRIVTLLGVSALALSLSAAPVFAGNAWHDSFGFSEGGVDGPASTACGFVVTYTLDVSGQVVGQANGSVIVHVNGIRSRFANGRSIVDNDAFTVTSYPDGSQTVTGTSWNLNQKGAGTVLLGAGKFVVDPNGVLTIIGGPEEWIETNVYDVVCPALAA
jgi:hypothetical protein